MHDTYIYFPPVTRLAISRRTRAKSSSRSRRVLGVWSSPATCHSHLWEQKDIGSRSDAEVSGEVGG